MESYSDTPAIRMPHFVASIPKNDPGILPEDFKINFARDTIHVILKGKEIADGFYVINQEKRDSKPTDDPFKALLCYRIIESGSNPFVPLKPGENGAQVTAYENELSKLKEYMVNCPVFVGDYEDGASAYKYIGHFSQPGADILGCKDLFFLPNTVKQHWANQLARPRRDADYAAVLKLYDSKGNKERSEQLEKLTSDQLFKALNTRWDAPEPSLTLRVMYMKFERFHTGFFEKFVRQAKTLGARLWFDTSEEETGGNESLEGERKGSNEKGDFETTLSAKTKDTKATHSPVPAKGSPLPSKQVTESFTIESLERLGFRREIEYGQQEHVSLAEYAYTRGKEAEFRCAACRESSEGFKDCVLIGEGHLTGACVNCFLKHDASNCTHFVTRNRRRHQGHHIKIPKSLFTKRKPDQKENGGKGHQVDAQTSKRQKSNDHSAKPNHVAGDRKDSESK